MLVFDSFHDAYLDTLASVLRTPWFETCPRGSSTKEILNYAFVVNSPESDVRWEETGAPERAEVTGKYWAKELAWYLSGSLEASTAPSKFWLSLADVNGKITSNYGFMTMFDEKYQTALKRSTGLERVVDLLKRDPDSRQAVIHYGEPKHFWEGNKDTPCCATNQFFLRDGKLFATVYMRSNDVIKGLTYDYKWFSFLQGEIAKRLGVLPGPLTYFAGSMHLYEKDFSLAEKILTPSHP
jgi:thymidylate synthase